MKTTNAPVVTSGQSFLDFAAEVAKSLTRLMPFPDGPDWSVVQPDPEYVHLAWSVAIHGPNDKAIFLSLDSDKVNCSGSVKRICQGNLQQFQHGYEKALFSAGVSCHRGPDAVAKAFITKILPTYLVVMESARNENEKYLKRLNERKAICAQLDKFGIRWDKQAFDNPGEYRVRGTFCKQQHESPLEYAKVEVTHDSIKIIETNDMSIDTAMAVLNMLHKSE